MISNETCYRLLFVLGGILFAISFAGLVNSQKKSNDHLATHYSSNCELRIEVYRRETGEIEYWLEGEQQEKIFLDVINDQEAIAVLNSHCAH